MAFLDEREAIAQLLVTGWTVNGAKKTPIAWPNQSFTPPSGPWIRFTLTAGDSFNLTMGGATNWVRHVGVLVVQLFDMVNTGDARLRQYADDVAAIYRGQWIDGGQDESIIFRPPSTVVVGVSDNWFQINCVIPYVRDTLL